MILAIDGPAGVGKSTIARAIAKTTGMLYLNSGNFYRGITWLVFQHEVDPEDSTGVITVAESCTFDLKDDRIYLNGQDVEDYLHTDAVDRWVATHSAIPEVREVVNKNLRHIALSIDAVVEGRDITTVVFPDADLKIFLDASIETRAKRRLKQGVSDLTFEKILDSIRQRDEIDRNKKVGSLKIAEDAMYLDTSVLTIDEVCEKVVQKIRTID